MLEKLLIKFTEAILEDEKSFSDDQLTELAHILRRVADLLDMEKEDE
jgi:hypothetical protein